MSKLGKQFQLVVADVVQEMDPSAKVCEGQWHEGPDGQREIDVIVEGAVGGVARKVQIECRDYNNEGRPIGIGAIDALESKHRDLGMDVSFLCSNAGFSKDAIRKAQRVGICLIGVLREDDPRIRYRVIDEIYVRRVECVPNSVNVRFDWQGLTPAHSDLRLTDITYDGAPVFNWLISRVPIFLASNPVVKGTYALTFRFKHPLAFSLPSGEAVATCLHMEFSIDGKWIAIDTEIDASSGLYDWIRRSVRLGPGAGRIVFKNVPFGVGGTPVKCPPGFDPNKLTTLIIGETQMDILDLGGFEQPTPVPNLTDFVVDEDTVHQRKNIPSEAFFS
jgi:hypothetical protein